MSNCAADSQAMLFKIQQRLQSKRLEARMTCVYQLFVYVMDEQNIRKDDIQGVPIKNNPLEKNSCISIMVVWI